MRVSGVAEYEGDENTVTRELPYIHRWTPVYKKMVLAKFYILEAWLKEHPQKVITMLTLTTAHGYNRFGQKSKTNDITIPDCFDLLKNGWSKLRKNIVNRGFDYVWILEPHRTGYPHIHVCIFGAVTEKDQNQIKKLWCGYGCGSIEQGAQFSEKAGADSIKSIRNYLMKYMIKAWSDSDWTTAQLVFNALVWANKWRLWGSSKKITKVMSSQPRKSIVDWQLAEIKTSKYADYMDTWRKPLPIEEYDFHKYDWRGKRSQIKPLIADCSQPIKLL